MCSRNETVALICESPVLQHWSLCWLKHEYKVKGKQKRSTAKVRGKVASCLYFGHAVDIAGLFDCCKFKVKC